MAEQVWRDGKLVDGHDDHDDTHVKKIQHALDQEFGIKEGLVRTLVVAQRHLIAAEDPHDEAMAILRSRNHEQIAKSQGVCEGLARALSILRHTSEAAEYNAACGRYHPRAG